MPSSLSPQEFVSKWRNVELKERSAAQSHFNDVCALLGEPTPVEADPRGVWYTFEAGAAKLGGGEGFADVWKCGYFAWEYKGQHADLDKAYEQLLKYRESLQNPPVLIVSDTRQILIHTNFTNSIKHVYTLALEDLVDPAKFALLKAAFSDPERLRPQKTRDQVTQAAAARFADLAALLRKYGEEPDAIARFLIRLLFCLFAEDIGLLPGQLFTRIVQTTRRRPDMFAQQLSALFEAMCNGGMFALEPVSRFDGGLFDDATVVPLDSDGLDVLAEVCGLDWSNLEPSIFGTLFERGLDPSKRSQLGAHYTSREDILLVVEPVLMAPLRRRWSEVKAQAQELATQARCAQGRARTSAQTKLGKLVDGLARELAEVRVLDPACGSGNFLYVALRQLLDLWKEVSTFRFESGLALSMPFEGTAPHPTRLHGIEINPYAHELAQATIWIGYLQWLHENGFGTPAEPILKPIQTILHMDAILAYDAQGRPVEPEWPAADVIISNPPFLGDKKMRAELGDNYVEDLRGLYAGRIPGQSDLCCYWFEKARAMIEQGQAKRAGLLATQGIRGGANRTVLKRIKRSGDIFWAQSDRDWILDGATVHVSMIGFDTGAETNKQLDDERVAAVHPNLSSGADLTVATALPENHGLSFIGTQKGGPFDIPEELARHMLAAPVNPNGRPNSDVVRPWLNAKQLTGLLPKRWIIDFGEMPIEAAAQYDLPFEYVRAHVKSKREAVKSEVRSTRHWWLHQRSRPQMRRATALLSRYVATPMVSKHRIFVWVPVTVVPENLLVVIAREDDYFFGVLQSKTHELWARGQGTQLREASSGQRYTPTSTFETFPFPWPPGQEPPDDPRVEAIAQDARELVAQRDAWLNPPGASEAELRKRTLTNLYNQRPTWLDLAHRKLDQAVFAAYGWPADLADDEVLRRVLELNLVRASAACGRVNASSA